MSTVQLELRDGVAVMWLDQPGGGPNLLDHEFLEQLPELLERLESDDSIEAVVIASKKPGFIAGADIRLFDEIASREAAVELLASSQRLIDRLESLPKPAVAAIDGACAGGGTELALACDYRLASTSPKTNISLPEVQLGLLPGLGGTQRLPRLIGLREALPMLLTGRKVYARPARRIGLVNATVHPEGLIEAAVEAARRLAQGSLQGRPKKRGVLDRVLETGPAKELIFRQAREQVERETRGNYPAPRKILELLRETYGKPLSTGLRLEAQAFVDLLFTPHSRAFRHLFFVRQKARKNRVDARPLEVERIGVLGAGLMGSGIAQVSVSPGGYRVVMKDQSFALVAKGKAAVHRGLSERVGKGMTRFERDTAVERLQAVEGYEPFGRAQLTIEAVLEDLALKREVLAKVDAVAQEAHIFASNTSSLPISTIAEGSRRPDRVVGMHYFSPVPKMPLLEVVRAARTSPEALATAVDVGLRQGKIVIVVEDSPGFYVNRILAPYLNEAVLLLRDGAAIEEVDRAMEGAGFPVGPFRLLDNVGLDVAGKVVEVLAPLFAQRGITLEKFGSRLEGLSGRKGGRGFYLYEGKGKRKVNDDIYRLLGAPERRTVPSSQIVERLLLAMVNEAAYCLDERIIASESDGDAGAVFGVGFPPFLGGPFHYLETTGRDQVQMRLTELVQRHGSRFEPAKGITAAAS